MYRGLLFGTKTRSDGLPKIQSFRNSRFFTKQTYFRCSVFRTITTKFEFSEKWPIRNVEYQDWQALIKYIILLIILHQILNPLTTVVILQVIDYVFKFFRLFFGATKFDKFFWCNFLMIYAITISKVWWHSSVVKFLCPY